MAVILTKYYPEVGLVTKNPFSGKTFNDYLRKKTETTTVSSHLRSLPVKRPKSKWLSKQWTKTGTGMSAKMSSNECAKVWPVNKWRPLSINSTKKGRVNSTTVNSALWCTVDSSRSPSPKPRRQRNRVNEIALDSFFFLIIIIIISVIDHQTKWSTLQMVEPL